MSRLLLCALRDSKVNCSECFWPSVLVLFLSSYRVAPSSLHFCPKRNQVGLETLMLMAQKHFVLLLRKLLPHAVNWCEPRYVKKQKMMKAAVLIHPTVTIVNHVGMWHPNKWLGLVCIFFIWSYDYYLLTIPLFLSSHLLGMSAS